MMPISTVGLAQKPLGARCSLGDGRLDEILGGGVRRGASVLIAGSSGTGKTTLAALTALTSSRRGENVLYISFEESEEALVGSLLNPGIDLRSAVGSGKLKILTAMPESMGIENHLLRIFEVMVELQPELVIVDAISACRRMGSEQAAFDFLVRLLTWCKKRGITFLCTNQTFDLMGPQQISGLGISSLIDTVIMLDQSYGEVFQRRILVVKSRGTRHSHAYHPFAITDDRLSFPAAADVDHDPEARV